ncbi:hypothetical protein BvRS1_38360 [Burkholderia vietnamiensis]|nr:hypothetical protein BvRS1_38360 [Burkholderia vietnamiensis]
MRAPIPYPSAGLFPDLIADNAADGRAANRAQCTTARQDRASDAADTRPDHGIRSAARHTAATRQQGNRHGDYRHLDCHGM